MSETAELGAVPEWTLGWRMQRALAHAAVSVEEMAEEIGISRYTISRWLNDRGMPPRTGYVKLWALRTGVSQEWLRYGASPQHDGGVFSPRTIPFRALTSISRLLVAA